MVRTFLRQLEAIQGQVPSPENAGGVGKVISVPFIAEMYRATLRAMLDKSREDKPLHHRYVRLAVEAVVNNLGTRGQSRVYVIQK